MLFGESGVSIGPLRGIPSGADTSGEVQQDDVSGKKEASSFLAL
jgi:hypothetical protein